jgi:aromatic ring-opening dioxygenase catalytic subunit (LigB family)
MPKILPAIFFGHGNPMNAVLDNGYTKAWTRIGQTGWLLGAGGLKGKS